MLITAGYWKRKVFSLQNYHFHSYHRCSIMLPFCFDYLHPEILMQNDKITYYKTTNNSCEHHKRYGNSSSRCCHVHQTERTDWQFERNKYIGNYINNIQRWIIIPQWNYAHLQPLTLKNSWHTAANSSNKHLSHNHSLLLSGSLIYIHQN